MTKSLMIYWSAVIIIILSMIITEMYSDNDHSGAGYIQKKKIAELEIRIEHLENMMDEMRKDVKAN